MGEAEDRGSDATWVDFRQRRRVEPRPADSPSAELPERSDPETFEGTELTGRLLGGGAVTPPDEPPAPQPAALEPALAGSDTEPDEFFNGLSNEEQPSDPPARSGARSSVAAAADEREDLDRWLAEQGNPHRDRARRADRRAAVDGTAQLPARTRRPRPARRPPAHPGSRLTHTSGRDRRAMFVTGGVIATLAVITITAILAGGQPGTPTRTEASSIGSVAPSQLQKTMPLPAEQHSTAKSTRPRSQRARAHHPTHHLISHRAAQNVSSASSTQRPTAPGRTSSPPPATPVQPAPAPAPTPTPVSNPAPSHSSPAPRNSPAPHRVFGLGGLLGPGHGNGTG